MEENKPLDPVTIDVLRAATVTKEQRVSRRRFMMKAFSAFFSTVRESVLSGLIMQVFTIQHVGQQAGANIYKKQYTENDNLSSGIVNLPNHLRY